MESIINILVVEDEALIAQKIKMQLQDFGYSIAAVCYNYKAAEKAIVENTFDVLITDIDLGNGIDNSSGLHIAQKVRQIKDCPIIFLTAFSDKETIKKATAFSPSAYLVKPVNAANLFAAVQVAVDNFINKNKPIEEKLEVIEYFFVKLGKKYIKVFWKDVYHLQAVKNYVKITTTENSNGFLVNGSLQQVLQNMLPLAYKNVFIKINRAEAIAKNIVNKIENDFVETIHGKFILTSNINKNEL